MNLTSIHAAVDGYKTYILAVVGMVTIFLYHIGWWPSSIPLTIDPANWLNDEWKMMLVITGRSALAK